MVSGLENVNTYPVLFAALLRRGWSEEDLLKVAGRNHLRAMRQMPPHPVEGPRSPEPVTNG